MSLIRTRRRKGVVATAAVALVAMLVTAAAIAYYPGSGSGSGSATAGTSPMSVDVTAAVSAQAGDPEPELFPGDTADVEITVTAPAAWPDGRRARIGTASASVDSGSLPAGCLASWFTFTPDAGFTGGFVTGLTPLVIAAGTITFTDENVDQSACSGATLTLDATVGA